VVNRIRLLICKQTIAQGDPCARIGDQGATRGRRRESPGTDPSQSQAAPT
jgi:hypothetical protein